MSITFDTILNTKPTVSTPPGSGLKEQTHLQAPSVEQASDVLGKTTPTVTDVKNTPKQPKRMSYEEMFKMLNPYQPPTKEELEKEKKKQKREQIFAAIGDGISALSNLYFTTKGAPNMYTGANNASERTRVRWDKLTAERNANMTAYINGLMRARQADDAYNDNERAWARQIGLDKIKQARDAAADARAEAQEKRDAEMHDLNKQLMDNKITQAEYDAKKAEVEAKPEGNGQLGRLLGLVDRRTEAGTEIHRFGHGGREQGFRHDTRPCGQAAAGTERATLPGQERPVRSA